MPPPGYRSIQVDERTHHLLKVTAATLDESILVIVRFLALRFAREIALPLDTKTLEQLRMAERELMAALSLPRDWGGGIPPWDDRREHEAGS